MIQPLIRAAILGSFAFFIVYLVRDGQLHLYIAPRMALYVKLSALGLYGGAMYQLYAALQAWMGKKQEQDDCECGHSHSHSHTSSGRPGFQSFLIYSLFILPLALGLLLPNTIMGSALAAKKGVSLTGSPTVNATEENAGQASESILDGRFPYDNFTEAYAYNARKLYGQETVIIEEKQFIETITTLDLYRDSFIGKEVEMSGFVYREDPMGPDQLVIARFAMNCCSADSMPYGLVVEYPGAQSFDTDSWLQITGTLQLANYNGNEVLSIKGVSMSPIAPPESPYVYPDFEFGEEFGF